MHEHDWKIVGVTAQRVTIRNPAALSADEEDEVAKAIVTSRCECGEYRTERWEGAPGDVPLGPGDSGDLPSPDAVRLGP